MPVDFESVKKLPVDEQITEFKRIITAADKLLAESKKNLADLEKEEKGEERDKKINELKKTIDEVTKDRNSAEQLLARAELDAKALETVLTQARGERKGEEETARARERDQLESILTQERTREAERKPDEKKSEDAYKPAKGYETRSVYEQQNKFYENANPAKQREENQPYKTRQEKDREQEVLRSMYAGSNQGYQ